MAFIVGGRFRQPPTSASVLFLCCSVMLLVGCGMRPDGASTAARRSDTIRVVATTGMVADLVRAVGGDHVSVDQVIGAGVDPHLYQPSRDDVALVMSGDLVFYSGLMLEGKLADTLIRIGSDKPVVAVTENIDEAFLLQSDRAGGHADPHVWMDVSAWSRCVDVVAGTLSEHDPARAEDYARHAKAYQAELAALHRYGLERLATVPKESRILITSHDAFHYFGKAYDLEVRGIQGVSTESEAGLQRINELVDLLVEKQIKAVFTESSVSDKNVMALIEGAASKGVVIDLGGVLFSDAMGARGTYEGTYIGMLDHNITTVTRSLGGEAPVGGMNGSLTSAAEAPHS